MHIRDTKEKAYTIALGYGKWIESEFDALPYYNPPFQGNFSNLPATWHVAGSYGWTDANTLNIQLHWIDWLTSASLQLRFSKQAPPTITITPHDTGKEVQVIAK
jgi:long-subunit fatty acid transport protein